MLSLIDVRRRIEAGALTPAAALAAARERVASGDGAIEAFVHLAPADAPVPAEGPLAGIAVGVKDIIDTADLPTGMGSVLYDGWRPRADAPVVAALRARGASVLGKTATTAFANADPAATRNPRNLDHTPGGSSSGSAAAVAAGFVPLALGTQTGGSVIRPAAFCGVAAIKPSARLLPTVGVKCFSWTLDTVGLFAAGVADLARALALIADRPGIEGSAGGAGSPRVGVVVQDFVPAADAPALAALDDARRRLERMGARVGDAVLPDECAAAWLCHPTIQDFEGVRALAHEYAVGRDGLPPRLGAALDAARAIPAERYDEARRKARRARAALALLFREGGFDALLAVSAPGFAPATLASTGDARFNRLWTLMGVPCVNVPVPFAPGELPLGVQVVAPFGRDDAALAVAGLVERALATGR